MKKFTFNCDFGGQIAPFDVYIGKPKDDHHPIHFQADWLNKQRGGMVPGDIMEALSKLQGLALKNSEVTLEELCIYALGMTTNDETEKEIDENLEDITTELENDESNSQEELDSNKDTAN